MHSSPEADARSLQHKSASRAALVKQTIFLLALLLAGLVVSYIVVRYVDPPKSGGAQLQHGLSAQQGALPA